MLSRVASRLLRQPQCRHISTTLLPDEVEMLRKTCWDFAESELKPIAGDVDKHSKYPADQVIIRDEPLNLIGAYFEDTKYK